MFNSSGSFPEALPISDARPATEEASWTGSPSPCLGRSDGFLWSWGIPRNGWFISWKIPSFEMDDEWGYSYFRKPPNDIPNGIPIPDAQMLYGAGIFTYITGPFFGGKCR